MPGWSHRLDRQFDVHQATSVARRILESMAGDEAPEQGAIGPTERWRRCAVSRVQGSAC